ncbi:gliding motility-associated C-terminal domain-containing protein [Flavobacterium sp. MFBS3-15]|uniref:T9SS type B sorting domain-containing protein n=1 Tax=Flavobacterium sp. MFBS3-15 TaxID=2989816 RepID=UPI0022365973|nr:gliding motility-associated C-terminal domain-containing protein [Flavobacterium sp. MFBS3-15]MCW4468072.1 gliding motility-associated C-terminal domain-containing protein [Flavobacterium sp. MFBS3-15]
MQKKIKLSVFRMFTFLIALSGTLAARAQCPSVTTISPSSGPANTVVAITGNNFQSGPAITAVQFNGVNAASFTIVSNTVVTAVVPVTAANGAVSVISGGCPAASGGNFTLMNSDCNPPAGGDVYISELYDHNPGSYGVIELYNPTDNTITFGGQYVLERYGEVGDTDPTNGYILTLPGSIAPHSTYLVSSYGSGVQGCTVTTVANLGGGINGNDEFKLKKNGTIIDIARAPVNAWYTVIRNPDATAPSDSYIASDWSITSSFSCANLGVHNAAVTDPPTITAQPQDSGDTCDNGFAVLSVALDDATGFSFQWKMLDSSGNWVNVTGSNYFDATTSMLIIDPVPYAFNGNQYYCEIAAPGCTLLSNSVTLTVLPSPVVTTNITSDCTLGTATLTITPVLGAGLTYKLNSGPFQASNTFTGLTPGTYTLTIQSSPGNCTATQTVTVNPITGAPDVATFNVVQPTCTVPTGTINVTAPTEAGMTYSIDGTTFDTATSFAGLVPGTYTITVKNAAGCTSETAGITINAVPNAPAVADVTVTQPTCTVPTGTITVNTPAGMTYSIDGVNFGTATSFAGLVPGTYNITVKNAEGCTSITGNIVINAVPGAPAVATYVVTQPDCATPSGTITITNPLVGVTYSLDGTNFSGTPSFAGLTPGTYTVTVKNAAGCTSVTGNIIIDAAPTVPAIADVTVTQPDCTTPTGTITVDAPAGLTYSIDGTNFGTTATFSGLVPGTYTITVKNAEGCTSVTGNITVNTVPNAPAVAGVTITQPTCTLPTGTITVDTPAGMTYSIDGTNFQAGTQFAGLLPGTYTVTVKNAAGCTSITGNITINAVPNAPAPATVSITQPTCDVPSGTITITDPLAGVTYSLDGVNFQGSPVFEGLVPGTYTVTVKNAVGCTSVSINHMVDPAPAGPAVPILAITQPTCAEPTGSITVTNQGTDITYSIDGLNFQTGTSFTGLIPGNTYTVTAKNLQGCTTVSSPTTLNILPAGPQITGTQGCRDTVFGSNYILEALPVDNSFDIATANFEWRNEAGMIVGDNENTFNANRYVADNNITISDFPIQIRVTVTTAAGCEATYSFTVDNAFCSIPRGISPNNDTRNDNFDITRLQASKIAIFNRYGQEVYAKSNYTNQWHGQADNGDELPTGTYYYMIETQGQSLTGWVYINRQEN